MRLTLASYNIHRCIGMDGRFEPERIFDVLCELHADIIALQEVETLHEGGLQLLELMSERTGLEAIAGPNILRDTGHYGNALLARGDVHRIRRIDLSFENAREPREAIAVDLDCQSLLLHVAATHLGLRPSERRFQIGRLLEVVSRTPRHFAALLGDFNEWLPWARPLGWINTHFGRTPAPATFPATFPLFALDRIWIWPRQHLLSVTAHKSALARVASDHLPLKAVLEI